MIKPARPLDPAVDDLFNDFEAQAPGIVAYRLLVWLRSPGTEVESPSPDVFVLSTSGGPVRVEWRGDSNTIRSVRYRLKSAPKDLAVEYFGVSVPSLFPADYPAGSRVAILDPGDPIGPLAHVFRIDSAEIRDELEPARYTWQSIASTVRREDTNEVLRSTGEVHPRATAMARAQQQMEPLKHTENPPSDGGLPKAIEKGPAWSRWLLVGGITSLVLAIGIGLRRRMGA